MSFTHPLTFSKSLLTYYIILRTQANKVSQRANGPRLWPELLVGRREEKVLPVWGTGRSRRKWMRGWKLRRNIWRDSICEGWVLGEEE